MLWAWHVTEAQWLCKCDHYNFRKQCCYDSVCIFSSDIILSICKMLIDNMKCPLLKPWITAGRYSSYSGGYLICIEKNNVIYLNTLNYITLQLVQYSKYSFKGTSWKRFCSFALLIFFLVWLTFPWNSPGLTSRCDCLLPFVFFCFFTCSLSDRRETLFNFGFSQGWGCIYSFIQRGKHRVIYSNCFFVRFVMLMLTD